MNLLGKNWNWSFLAALQICAIILAQQSSDGQLEILDVLVFP